VVKTSWTTSSASARCATCGRTHLAIKGS
jgi:hypothetical protein